MNNPKVFISYSWESNEHRAWVNELGSNLKRDGISVMLDQWHLIPGEQLPSFMERCVRENNFVLIVCTPTYKEKSDCRRGGVGYEGNIMTAEVFSYGNHLKFIPILREGLWTEAAPSWLLGKYYIDLRGKPYSDEQYRLLLRTLHGVNPSPPSIPSTQDLIHFDWITIPEGPFPMGTDLKDDPDAWDVESPEHSVHLSRFSIARVEVTNAQYKVFIDQINGDPPPYWENGEIPENKEHHPVVGVNWYDALKFCDWAGVRLPNEAEWEKAARSVDRRRYPWGSQPPDKRACNYDMNVGDTTSVIEYPKGASPYGVLDMVGNVWEWTSTLWGLETSKPLFPYPFNLGDGRQNLNADETYYRVLRGGAYDRYAKYIRATYRRRLSPMRKYSVVGFRVAKNVLSL
jgi:formylglycine-generating enzyme required for sulfatase activity